MNIIKVLTIGTPVTILDNIQGIINSIQIRPNNTITYCIARVNENGDYIETWHWEHEITSEHKEQTIIQQCVK